MPAVIVIIALAAAVCGAHMAINPALPNRGIVGAFIDSVTGPPPTPKHVYVTH